ncbi:hypothetical protein HO419_05495 [Streptococcus suis]|uniref:Uncharacterized protein n=1 Tax=Streptococcus suis TaxID=1307 RepID=A0A0Z8MSK0_STRSU|nr:hypothetical protein [Streptococcus suis]NQG76550.1 hypothetical protein [Streptococcus suis]NQG80361.1 hypothetical protein [Streptococcus suis]NQJ61723.1 hypothetical protein [Streptococcus suis]NQJ65643.1 hypothetical protein [Streptococcus suis]NQM25749.1 hypothetical protein [Streptococcus suis]
MKSYKQNRGEKMYFQKTEHLLNKIKLYKDTRGASSFQNSVSYELE